VLSVAVDPNLKSFVKDRSYVFQTDHDTNVVEGATTDHAVQVASGHPDGTPLQYDWYKKNLCLTLSAHAYPRRNRLVNFKTGRIHEHIFVFVLAVCRGKCGVVAMAEDGAPVVMAEPSSIKPKKETKPTKQVKGLGGSKLKKKKEKVQMIKLADGTEVRSGFQRRHALHSKH
jgi:hypothetical protein